MWHVVFTRQAAKDAKRLKVAGLDAKANISLADSSSHVRKPPSFSLSSSKHRVPGTVVHVVLATLCFPCPSCSPRKASASCPSRSFHPWRQA